MGRLYNFFYNLDRAVASLGGAPPQHTISDEVGRVRKGDVKGHFWLETQAARFIAWMLGKKHTDVAIEHADKLDKCDDGKEQ